MKLVKQIDALTENARNVINALIRSTMKAGSYDGFTVTRAGEPIKLDRADIYRLYRFYEEWEYRTGTTPFDPDMFDSIMEANDLQVGRVEGRNTADVLIKHSKMLYQNVDNVKVNTDDDWLDLIRHSYNPKLVSNSAPIPMNIRAPIYDENLSTKHYSQYETYLFPGSYNALDIVGYQGDGLRHVGGGYLWNWEIDSKFGVNADTFLFGRHRFDDVKKHPYTSSKETFAFMVGAETYAYGHNSFAGGSGSVAYGNNSFAYGTGNIAYGTDSASVGSLFGNSVGTMSFTSGSYVNALSDCSAALNCMTNAGGTRYKFTIYEEDDVDIAESGTQCRSTVVVDGCTYTKAASSTRPASKAGLAPNQIMVAYRDMPAGGMMDIQQGDEVILYGWRMVSRGGGMHTAGDCYACKPVVTKVTKLALNADGDYILTLDKDVTVVDGLVVAGGYVSVYKVVRNNVFPYGSVSWGRRFASPMNALEINPGWASTALNYGTTAVGEAQTVVGSSNIPMFEPRFIVGCGNISGLKQTAYDVVRDNSFVSGPRYSFMKLANSRVVVGVSDHNNTGDRLPATGIGAQVVSDEATGLGVYQMTGAYSVSWNDSFSVRGLSHVSYDRAELSAHDDGIRVLPIETNDRTGSPEFGYRDISTLVGGSHGSTVIWSGNDLEKEQMMWERYQYINARGSNMLPICRVNVYGRDGITLESPRSIKMISRKADEFLTSYIDMDFERLVLSGQTYGALAADCTSRSYSLRGDALFSSPNTMAHNRETHSGFHFDWTDGYLPNNGLPAGMVASHYCDAYHSIVSSYVYSTISSHFSNNHASTSAPRAYDVSGLILPGALTDSIMQNLYVMPRVQFFSNTIFGDGNGGKNPEGACLYEEMAYMRDVDTMGKTVASERVGTGTYCRVESGVVKTDVLPTLGYNCTEGYIGKPGAVGSKFGIVISKKFQCNFTTPWKGVNSSEINDIGYSWDYDSFGCQVAIGGSGAQPAGGVPTNIGCWGVPLLDKLNISLCGHQFMLSAVLCCGALGKLLPEFATDESEGKIYAIRMPIYLSTGSVRYTGGKMKCPVMESSIERAVSGDHPVLVSAYFPVAYPAMVLNIELKSRGKFEMQWDVPFTLHGIVPFTVAEPSQYYIDSHFSTALNYWHNKTALTHDQIYNFKLPLLETAGV